MTQKQVLEIFDELDLSSLRHNFEIINYRYFDKNLRVEQQVEDYWIQIEFNVQGEHYVDHFHLMSVEIKEVILWLEEEKIVILESSLVKIEKKLIKKLTELT